MEILAKRLSHSSASHITEIRFESDLDDLGAARLAEWLKTNPNIQLVSLNLNKGDFNDFLIIEQKVNTYGSKHFGDALRVNNKLTSLTFNCHPLMGTKWDVSAIKRICRGLDSNNTLTHLDIS